MMKTIAISTDIFVYTLKNRIVYLVICMLIPLSANPMEKSKMINTDVFAYSGIENIVIDGSMYEIQVIGESRSDVKGIMESSDAHILRHRQTEQTLNIWYTPVFKLPSFKKHSVKLFVPDSVRITIETSSGCIGVRSMHADLQVRSTSGTHCYNDSTGKISAHSSSGSISVASQQGQLQIQTSSGKITGENISLTESSSFKSTSGSISIALSNPLEDCSFDLNASSGTLRVESETARKKMIWSNGPIVITGKSTSGSQNYMIKAK